ncbi:hypothetical protein Q9S71_15020 [Microbacterium sp. KSW4-11]|uniref:Uncharacterized protein n=1 Tax=Microbacterium gawkjiense TaxID=3067309 RepID=A0ABU3GEB7_9MICO|nr:hypothetical protein [Microbacterium sp. KSW4-11]MDT3318138.1 hypothetical protein [Microbacterium sp. KSW4-11]
MSNSTSWAINEESTDPMTDVVFSPAPTFLTSLETDDRLRASVARLRGRDYGTTAAIEESTASDWPGDVAGRLLLTLSRFARDGHETRDRTRELFEAMLDTTADVGYFGTASANEINEQQVACHGWVVSAYLQYEVVSDDPRALDAATRVVDELILPALAKLSQYPRERELVDIGEPSGTAMMERNGWLLSTDTWCVFLALNALVPVWERTRRRDIHRAIVDMAGVANEVDFVAQRAQLHASLAAARNLARFAVLSGSEEAENAAVRIYRDYVQSGRTLNWATFNWFGRHDTWTEPCAIVDSIGLEFALFDLTGDPGHLENIRRIEHNAMAFAQRDDGSFGLDAIATAAHPEIYSISDDAWWCCTMRGALGVIDLRDRSARFNDQSRCVEVLVPRSGIFEDARLPGWRLLFVKQGDVLTIEVASAPQEDCSLTLAFPGIHDPATLPAKEGSTLVIPLPADETVEEVAAGQFVRMRGDVLLDANRQALAGGDRGLTAASRTLTFSATPSTPG